MADIAIRKLSNRELIDKLRKRPKVDSGDGEGPYIAALLKETPIFFNEKIGCEIAVSLFDRDPKRGYSSQKQAEGLLGARFTLEGVEEGFSIGFDRMAFEYLAEGACGGSALFSTADTERSLTPIDRKLGVVLLTTFIEILQKTTAALTKKILNFQREDLTLEQAMEQVSHKQNRVLTLALGVGDAFARIVFFSSQAGFNALWGDPAQNSVSDNGEDEKHWRKTLFAHSENVETILTATIEESDLTVGDFDDLAVGSVLALKASPTSPIALSAHDRALFHCNLGQEDGFYTLRVLQEARADRRSPQKKAMP